MSHATQEKKYLHGQHSWQAVPRHTKANDTAGRQGRFYYCDRCLTAVWILPFLGLCFTESARTGLDKAGASGPTSISLWPGVGWVWSCKSLRLEKKKKFCSDVLDYIATYVFCLECQLVWSISMNFHWVLAQWFTLALQEASKYMPRRELRVVDTEFVMETSFDSGKKITVTDHLNFPTISDFNLLSWFTNQKFPFYNAAQGVWGEGHFNRKASGIQIAWATRSVMVVPVSTPLTSTFLFRGCSSSLIALSGDFHAGHPRIRWRRLWNKDSE